jgi:hypothetical protein
MADSQTTPTRYDIISEWLGEAVEKAKEGASDNYGDQNSFGSGYDQGYLAALKAVRDFMNGDADA